MHKTIYHFISPFLLHVFIITLSRFIRQILREKLWIPFGVQGTSTRSVPTLTGEGIKTHTTQTHFLRRFFGFYGFPYSSISFVQVKFYVSSGPKFVQLYCPVATLQQNSVYVSLFTHQRSITHGNTVQLDFQTLQNKYQQSCCLQHDR